MKAVSSHAVLIALLFVGGTAQAGDGPIFPKDARLEKVFDGGSFTEGVAVAPDGTVYFSDIPSSGPARAQKKPAEAGRIWKLDPKTRKATIFRSPSGKSNGIKFDADGNMVICEGADFGGRRVVRTDMKTGNSIILAADYEGRAFNSPNDLSVDARGRIYFSDPRYLGHEPIEQPVQAVYRIDPDGSLTRVVTDAGKPNGVCVSPDQKTLYVVCNDNGNFGIDLPEKTPVHKGRMALLAYDLAPDGSARFRKVLVDYAPQDGPDGMVCDADGNLYVAVRDETRPGIRVYTPDGKELAYLQTPQLPTNVGFGRGSESRTLYITAGDAVYRVGVNREGYHLRSR